MIELMSAEEIAKIEEETEFKPLPKGKYRVQVAETVRADSKKGNDMITWTLKTVDCDDASHNNRVLYHYTVLPTSYTPDQMDKNGADGKPLAYWATKTLTETVMAFGESQFDEDNISEWIGKECLAAVVLEDYEGNPTNKIGRLLPL